jgi:hypothetical protein
MENAIIISFVTGAFTLLGGIIVALIRKALSFNALKREVFTKLAEISSKIDNVPDMDNEHFLKHFSSSELFHTLEKAQRQHSKEQLEDIKLLLKEIRSEMFNRSGDMLILKTMEGIKDNMEKK